MKLWTAIKALWCAVVGHDYGALVKHKARAKEDDFPYFLSSWTCRRCGHAEWFGPPSPGYIDGRARCFLCEVDESFFDDDPPEKPKPSPVEFLKDGDTKRKC